VSTREPDHQGSHRGSVFHLNWDRQLRLPDRGRWTELPQGGLHGLRASGEVRLCGIVDYNDCCADDDGSSDHDDCCADDNDKHDDDCCADNDGSSDHDDCCADDNDKHNDDGARARPG